MKHRTLTACSVVAFAATLAQAAPTDDAKAAAKKLSDAANYSWTTTMQNAGGGGGGGRFQMGPVNGKAEKDGFALITRQGPNGTVDTIVKGSQRVTQTENGWKTPDELRAEYQNGGGAGGGNRARGRGGFAFGAATTLPAEELARLVNEVKDFKEVDGTLVGDLAAEYVAPMLAFGGRGGTPPEAKNASGTVKLWITSGAIAKFEVHVKGTVEGRNGPREIDRTSTTEITNVGTTKVDVPDAAKAKFSS